MTIIEIDKIPKTININGCWIPFQKPNNKNGYVDIKIEGKEYYLHRLSMCAKYNIDYKNNKVETRHSKDCIRSCFNYNHLQPGTISENRKDVVLHGRHNNANKLVCPKCNGKYTTYILRSGSKKGKSRRMCLSCMRKKV